MLPHFTYCTPAFSHPSALVHKLAQYVSLQSGNALAHFHRRKLQNEPSSLSTPKGYLQAHLYMQTTLTMSECPASDHIGEALYHKFPLDHIYPKVLSPQRSVKSYLYKIVSHLDALSCKNS